MSTARRERLKQARKRGLNRFLFYIGKLDGTIDASGDTGVAFTVYARSLNDPEYVVLYFNPVQTPYALLAQNASVLASIQSDGNYWIERVAYQDFNEQLGGNPPPSNMGDMIHTHENDSQGGQLNASLVFNNGAVPVGYGGTNITSYAVGDLLYASAAGVLSKLAVGSNGNIYHVAGGLPVSGTLNLSTANLSGLLAYARGGLNVDVSGLTTGALLVKGASAASGLAPGTSGNIAQSNGSIWQSVAPSFAANVITSGQLLLERGGTEADLSATGAGFAIQATTGAALTVPKSNFTATAAPGASDDNTQGYVAGKSFWMDLTNGNIYWCAVDTTAGAVWEHLNATSGGSSPWTGTGEVYLVDPTNPVIIGDTGEDLGRFTIRGIADEPQLAIRLNGTQTQPGVTITNAAVATVFNVSGGGDIYGLGALEIDGALNHDGSTVGLYGATPLAQQAQTVDLKDAMVAIGIIASAGGATPLDTDGGLVTAFLQAEASTTSVASANIPDAIAAPSAPNEGDLWKLGGLIGYTNGIAGFIHRRLYAQTATVGNTNSSSELTLIGSGVGSVTLPADFFDTIGRTVIFRLFGNGTCSGTQTLTYRVKFGSTTLAATAAMSLAITSTNYWHADIEITCRTTGASGTVMVNGSGQIGAVNFDLGNAGTDAVDTTGTLTLDFTGQWSGATNTMRCTNASVWAA